MANPAFEIPGKVLVRGCPLKNCKNFSEILRNTLDSWQGILAVLGIKTLNALQERIIFALECDDLDLFIVGPKNVGKRTAYLIPMLATLMTELNQQYFTPEERTSAPSSIIICESTEKAMQLYDLLQRTFRNNPSHFPILPSVALLDNIHNESMINSVAQPVDILILTGASLQELLCPCFLPMLSSLNLNFHRTRFVVFEELAMKTFFMEKEVHQFINHMDNQSADRIASSSLQLIFSGTVWDNTIIGSLQRFFHSRGRKSVAIFGSSLHALQYASSIQYKVEQVPTEKSRLNSLIGICKGMMNQKRKSVVACSTPEVAIKVSKYISANGEICNKVITSGSLGDTQGVFRKCTDWLGSVLVVADNAWQYCDVSDASCLIHFDIEIVGSTTPKGNEEEPLCLERFGCLWNRMEKVWRGLVEPHGITYFLLSGHEPNFLAVFKFLQSMNAKMPQSLETLAEKKWQKEEMEKTLCMNLKCFAYCNVVGCPDRHEFSQADLDSPPHAPNNGELEFRVVESISPSLYVAKLLEHLVFDEKTGKTICAKSYRDEEYERRLQMSDYYSTEGTRIRTEKVPAGELLCFPYRRQKANGTASTRVTYLRAKFMGFMNTETHEVVGKQHGAKVSTEYAQIFLIDTGHTLEVPFKDLLVLPDQFKKWKPLSIQVVLSNMLYLEETREYYSDALQTAKQLTEGKIWRGKVLLSIDDTVWVNPMIQYEADSDSKEVCNLTEELVHGKGAACQKSQNHMMMMLEHIRKRVPNYPEIEEEICSFGGKQDGGFHRKGDPILWAELPLSGFQSEDEGMELIPLQFVIQNWKNPWEIFGTVSDGESFGGGVIQRMEAELDREMEKMKKARVNYSGFLEVDSVVAVKTIENSGKWRRGLISERNAAERDGEISSFNVFLVDYGTTAFNLPLEQVLPIRKIYVEELPFQTVCLRLAHVQPLKGQEDWDEQVLKQFSSVMEANNPVNMIAFSKLDGRDHRSNYYEAMMFYGKRENGSKENFTYEEIGDLLVKKGLAATTKKIELIADVMEFLVSNKNTDEMESSGSEYSSSGVVGALNENDYGDNDSESSLEMWQRFRDEAIENGEYVAIGLNEAQEIVNGEAPGAEDEDEKAASVRNIIQSACEAAPGLVPAVEEPEQIPLTEYQEDDDEFYDAEDYDGFAYILPEDQESVSELSERFRKTIQF